MPAVNFTKRSLRSPNSARCVMLNGTTIPVCSRAARRAAIANGDTHVWQPQLKSRPELPPLSRDCVAFETSRCELGNRII
eukprot:351035-Chlamydomonas_euryale.AAC.2